MLDFLLSSTFLYAVAALALIALLAGLIALKLTARPADTKRYPGEHAFLGDETHAPVSTGNLDEPATLDLSLVIPAYNETKRLPAMMEKTMTYLLARKKAQPSFTYEVIIVDDGSRDKTSELGVEYSKKYGFDIVRVLKLHHNRGKGGAVRMGVLSARGAVILMVDADGATEINDLDRVEAEMNKLRAKGPDGVVVGSRAHLVDDVAAERSFFRNLLMHAFHILVYILCVKGIRDTQCGFKLFTRKSANRLFSVMHIERWAFDVELLFIAQSLGIPISEVSVNWQEIDGSKLDPVSSSIQMGRDLFLIRAYYMTGFWSHALPSKAQ
eukprot:m.359733 g.359733  ORF g.359733 m.359733 type:complete len:326 (-) comp56003_c0_seq2:110-1087(-)